MIETISEFLEEFKKKGLEQISFQDSDISHTVTIGDIYEGLTSEILKRAIFKGFNLNIVNNSFIYNESGNLSKEMDCMVVTGNGKQISFTNRYKYHIKDVIAVIQVKKKLYKDALDDAHQNLKSVIDTAEPRNGERYMGKIHYDAYKLLMTKELPNREDLENFSYREKILYHFLLMQSFWPLRILIGYDSYKTEYKLREAFVEHLEELTKDGPKEGYNPISFPDLMICGTNSIIKNVGMPFGAPLDHNKEFYWNVLMSSPKRPMYLLLELIWTRLCYKFSVSSEIFGDDFSFDEFHPFISTRERKLDKKKYGWEYKYHALPQNRLNLQLSKTEWSPTEIDLFEQVLLISLINQGTIPCDIDFKDYCEKHKGQVGDVLKKWTENRIAYCDNNEIILLLEQPVIISMQDGKTYIGENKSGEMSNWVKKSQSK